MLPNIDSTVFELKRRLEISENDLFYQAWPGQVSSLSLLISLSMLTQSYLICNSYRLGILKLIFILFIQVSKGIYYILSSCNAAVYCDTVTL